MPIKTLFLMAFLISGSALGIDALLTSLPQIGSELSPDAPNRAHLSISLFFVGIAFGTIFWGPISDAFGRKPALFAGLALYGGASAISVFSNGLDMLLVGRLMQGVGSAAMRIVVNAMVRDQFSGAMMARVTSFITLIFVMVPGIAPLLGYWISQFYGWRGVFWAFTLFSIIGAIWLYAQQKETLAPKDRRPLRLGLLRDGCMEILGSAQIRKVILIQSLCYAGFASFLINVQQIFEIGYARADSFPYLMGLGSLLGGVIALTNAWAVVKFGIVRPLRFNMIMFTCFSGLTLLASQISNPDIGYMAFLIWMVASFVTVNAATANTIALTLHPLPHLAGLATSVTLTISAFVGGLASIPVRNAFDGTYVPLVFVNFVVFGIAAFISLRLREADRDM